MVIEITAKSKAAFLLICKSYNIKPRKAIFVDSSVIIKEPPVHSPHIFETNVKRDGSDWLAYQVVY